MCLNGKKKLMKTQHLGWLSCSLLRGRIIYLKLLVASRTHRVYERFYKIYIVETKRQVNPCHQGKAPSVRAGNKRQGIGEGNTLFREVPSGCWQRAWCFQTLALFNPSLVLTDP